MLPVRTLVSCVKAQLTDVFLGLSPATRERRRKEFKKYQELTGELFRAGVPLLAGTDAPEPYCPPGLNPMMKSSA